MMNMDWDKKIREEASTMIENRDGFAHEQSDKSNDPSGMPDLQQMLQRVDKILAEFYEIHGSQIKDPGHNP